MNTETGEIRELGKIPKKEIEDNKWSEPFHTGEIVVFKGARMRIAKIKRFKRQILLEFEGPALERDGKDIASRPTREFD